VAKMRQEMAEALAEAQSLRRRNHEAVQLAQVECSHHKVCAYLHVADRVFRSKPLTWSRSCMLCEKKQQRSSRSSRARWLPFEGELCIADQPEHCQWLPC